MRMKTANIPYMAPPCQRSSVTGPRLGRRGRVQAQLALWSAAAEPGGAAAFAMQPLVRITAPIAKAAAAQPKLSLFAANPPNGGIAKAAAPPPHSKGRPAPRPGS